MTGTAITVGPQIAEVLFSSFDLDAYDLFLRTKRLPESKVEYDWESDSYRVTTPARFASMLGVAVPKVERSTLPIADYLFDYQQYITRAALTAKRYAIYADCGLGKTAMELEWTRHVGALTGGKVLNLAPPQVIPQTIAEAERFYPGEEAPVPLSTRAELIAWLNEPGGGVAVTNYEKMIDGVIPEMRNLAGLVCDESSILKSGGGVIKWNLIKSAKGIEYKLSCTATPAPNDVMEYASQAAFLEKLRTEGEILWTFFSRINKGPNAGNWMIKPHARDGFYRFMASWSIYLRNPAAYGWADNLRSVPKPEYFEHRIPPTEQQMRAASELFHASGAGLLGDRALGITQRTKLSQLAKGFLYEGKQARPVQSRKPQFVARLIADEVAAGHQVLVWTSFDEEAQLLAEELTAWRLDASGLRGEPIVRHAVLDGSVPKQKRPEMIAAFQRGEVQVLLSKASLLGFGMNLQCCSSMIFSGWDDSFERFYQAVRRAYRYGQTRSVRVHIPFIPELEGAVLENVKRKQENFERDAELQEAYYREAMKGLAA